VWQRILAFGAAVGLIFPEVYSSLAGFLVAAFVLASQRFLGRATDVTTAVGMGRTSTPD
jgi:hypothetical protein